MKNLRYRARLGTLSLLLALFSLTPPAAAAPLEEQFFGIANGLAGVGCQTSMSGPTKVNSTPVPRIEGSLTFSCNRNYSLLGTALCVEVLEPVWTQVGCGSAVATNSSGANTGASIPCVTPGPMEYRLVGVGVALLGGNNTWRVFASVGPTATITCSGIGE